MKFNKKQFSLFGGLLVALALFVTGAAPLHYALTVINGICDQAVNFTGQVKINSITTQAFSYENALTLDDAALLKHAHSNKTLLDTYAQSETDLADAVSKKHGHTNKTLLDTYAQSETDLADAVSKKHAHSNAAVLAKFSEAAGKPQYDGQAIGGAPSYTVVTITSSGSWTVPAGVTLLKDIWLIAGGGGGGSATGACGAGGGAGGVLHLENIIVTPGDTISFTIGAGGTGGDPATNGGNSTVTIAGKTYTAIGGGFGNTFPNNVDAGAGGSGGGQVAAISGELGKGTPETGWLTDGFGTIYRYTYTPKQGMPGGAPLGGHYAAGGGGFSEKGGDGSNPNPGKGGDGIDLRTYLGNAYGDNGWFAGGGAGGFYNTGNQALGGKGGGGNGGSVEHINGYAAIENTGAGGGGAVYAGSIAGVGGNGAKGIGIIRH